jgi:hypothetical protein
MSPNSERFQPPKLWKAIGTGIGTLTPTMPIWMRLEIARDVAVAGEDRDPVAVFVVVDELGRMIEIGAAHAREHRPEDLLPVDPHLRLDLVEQAAVEEKAVLVTLQFETAAVDDEHSPFPDAEIDIGAHAVEMLAGDERPSAPERPDALARSRVWIRGDEPRIGVGRLDDPYRDDARVSAVRGYERATDLELLTNGLLDWLVTGLFCGWFCSAL